MLTLDTSRERKVFGAWLKRWEDGDIEAAAACAGIPPAVLPRWLEGRAELNHAEANGLQAFIASHIVGGVLLKLSEDLQALDDLAFQRNASMAADREAAD